MAVSLVVGAAWITLNKARDGGTDERGSIATLPQQGYAAPDFTLETLDGPEVTLSDLRGNVVLANFWATWCPPCRNEMAAIQEVYDQYHDQGFVVLAVDYAESDGQVKDFRDQLALTFPILMDRDGAVFERYRVKSIPTTFFVDRSGVIQDIIVGGPMPHTLIERQVTTLLAGKESE